MIDIPEPAIELVDDPGDPLPEVYDGPTEHDLCPGCGGPEVYMVDGCCKYAYNMFHLTDYLQQVENDILRMMQEEDWREF